MKTLLVLLWLVSLACFPPRGSANPTMRCIVEKSVNSTLKRSAAVFSGEVLEIKNGRNFMEARFKVERSWKGVDAEEEVTVLVDSTVESPHYRIGQKYLVLAGLQYGKLFTGNCSRTKKIADAEGDLQQLGEAKNRK